VSEIANSYKIKFSIEDFDMNFSLKSLQFNITDSIKNPYPSLSFSLDDSIGVLQNIHAFTQNFKVKIYFGYKDETMEGIENSFIISDRSLQPNNFENMGGRPNINCIHSLISEENKISKSYKNRISNIVRSLVRDKGFNSININDTGNYNVYYQPMMGDMEFIQKVLLPNAYSTNSNKSPFFCFIDSGNNFNFRNYFSMIKTSPVDTLTLSDSNNKEINNQKVFSIISNTTNINYTRPLYNTSLFYQNNSGEYEEDNNYIDSYPRQTNKRYPVKNDVKDNITNYRIVGDLKDTDANLRENNLAKVINKNKNSLFLERFTISTLYNPKLKAGKTVTLKIPSVDSKGNKNLSNYYTDTYLIEQSSQIWNGLNLKATTQCIVSRKTINVTKNTKFGNKLL